jgi:uncharacterized repeat protein (TIGR01451 family)
MGFSRTARGLTMLVTLVAVSLTVGACCPRAPQYGEPWSVEVTPVEDTNPTKTQHTFIATVFDQGGNPIPNVQVHWILARTGDAVGDVVTYDDQDLAGVWYDLTTKTDNQYAVSYTNEQTAVLHRGMRWVADETAWTDFEVGPGQTWCTITSPVEGTSHMIVFVPAIKDALCHKVFAVKHWQRVPHLVAMKECPSQALVGSQFQYRLTIMNDGEGATPGPVEVMEMLPEGITIVDGTAFPQNLGVMNPGDSKTITFMVRADTPGTKVNRIQANAGEFVARADCTTNVVGYGIDLTKECGGRYVLGSDVPFTIRVTNTESSTLTNVVVNDPLPAGVEYVSADASKGMARVGADGRSLVWDGFELAGRDSATLTINTRATGIGIQQNTATVTASVAGADMQVTDSDNCELEIIGLPSLNIDKVCEPTQCGIGDPVTFRITVWNSGGADAMNVSVNDVMPAGIQAMGETSWIIDRLPPSGPEGGRTFTINATAMTGGRFTNVATANAEGATEVRDACDVEVLGPTLTIRKDCKATNPPVAEDITVLNRMDSATHTIVVTNGNVRAQDVVVVDRLPLNSAGRERLKYESSNPAGTYDAVAHTVTWNLGTMEANQTATIEVVFQGVDIGPAVNTASVTARGFGGAQDDCRLFVLGSPAFQNSVYDALNGDPDADNFRVNTPFDYIILVQNEGEADLQVTMHFTLSGDLALESRPIGFIPDARSTADPTGADVLAVTDAGGGKYDLAPFNMAPKTKRWLRIPVRGINVTSTDAATINIDMDWQLWFEGRLFPRKGRVSFGETSVIDPQ